MDWTKYTLDKLNFHNMEVAGTRQVGDFWIVNLKTCDCLRLILEPTRKNTSGWKNIKTFSRLSRVAVLCQPLRLTFGFNFYEWMPFLFSPIDSEGREIDFPVEIYKNPSGKIMEFELSSEWLLATPFQYLIGWGLIKWDLRVNISRSKVFDAFLRYSAWMIEWVSHILKDFNCITFFNCRGAF